MAWLKKIALRLVAKKVIAGVGEKQFEASKAKLTAVVYVLVLAVEQLSPAFGHPIVIPPSVFRFLEAIGLWTLRDALPAKAATPAAVVK